MLKHKLEDYESPLFAYKQYSKLMISRASQIREYNPKHWPNEFCVKEAKEPINELIELFKWFDFTSLPVEDLKEMGFNFWEGELLLYPLWALRTLKEGAEIIAIDGEKSQYTHQTNGDMRMGCTAYGFIYPTSKQS